MDNEVLVNEVVGEEACSWWSCAWNCMQNEQFWYGVAAGIILFVIIYLLCKCLFHRGISGKMLTVEDSELGRFSISTDALCSFVRGVAKADNPKVVIENLRLVEKRDGMSMVIVLQAPTGTELVQYRMELREQVFHDLKSKLGVDGQLKAIDFEIHEMDESGIKH